MSTHLNESSSSLSSAAAASGLSEPQAAPSLPSSSTLSTARTTWDDGPGSSMSLPPPRSPNRIHPPAGAMMTSTNATPSTTNNPITTTSLSHPDLSNLRRKSPYSQTAQAVLMKMAAAVPHGLNHQHRSAAGGPPYPLASSSGGGLLVGAGGLASTSVLVAGSSSSSTPTAAAARVSSSSKNNPGLYPNLAFMGAVDLPDDVAVEALTEAAALTTATSSSSSSAINSQLPAAVVSGSPTIPTIAATTVWSGGSHHAAGSSSSGHSTTSSSGVVMGSELPSSSNHPYESSAPRVPNPLHPPPLPRHHKNNAPNKELYGTKRSKRSSLEDDVPDTQDLEFAVVHPPPAMAASTPPLAPSAAAAAASRTSETAVFYPASNEPASSAQTFPSLAASLPATREEEEGALPATVSKRRTPPFRSNSERSHQQHQQQQQQQLAYDMSSMQQSFSVSLHQSSGSKARSPLALTATGGTVASSGATEEDEDDVLQRVMRESQLESEQMQRQQELIQQQQDELMQLNYQQQQGGHQENETPSHGLSTISSEELLLARENAQTLRSLLLQQPGEDGHGMVDMDTLHVLLGMCTQDRDKIENSIRSTENPAELEQLFDLFQSISSAIEEGQELIRNRGGEFTSSSASGGNASDSHLSNISPQHLTGGAPSSVPTDRDTRAGGGGGAADDNIDVQFLMETEDVFSLICIVRAQQNIGKRLDAALALMHFARAAQTGGTEKDVRIRDEICSFGGLHSLRTLFRVDSQSYYEVKVVAALAMAYVLPSYMESSSPSMGLKIVECLRFLSSCNPVSPRGIVISKRETFLAASTGLASFWINHLEPMLQSNRISAKNDDVVSESVLTRRREWSAGRRGRPAGPGGVSFDQRQETLALQELLEMTVSLIIYLAGQSDQEPSARVNGGESAFHWRYTLVEQICAVEMARPIAVREGILQTLVSWIRSHDIEKIRPAASALRYLTSINDKYMAGWIHSQMVNKGAVKGLADLVKPGVNISHDVRLAIAQILSSLCAAPHTRAAVVEANCIQILIGFLYEPCDTSEELALFAGRALLQLAAGAITRATVLSGEDLEAVDYVSPDKRDSLVDDIMQGGAIDPFVAIARERRGKLRSVAVEALRVLSEDISPRRQTRLQLCECGAAKALGATLKDGVLKLGRILKTGGDQLATSESLVKDLHEALCALANIFEPIQESYNRSRAISIRSMPEPRSLLIHGCKDMAQSGGLESLLNIASIAMALNERPSCIPSEARLALLGEVCRSLDFMSPLLLTELFASEGYARWAHAVLCTLQSLMKLFAGDDDILEGSLSESDMLVHILQGVGALASSDPLKIRIVGETLPFLLHARGFRDSMEVSNAATQAFHFLGFAEDEVAIQVAGNNPFLLATWFCLQRSLVIQAMVRDEIREIVAGTWGPALREIKHPEVTLLIRETSERSRTDEGATRSGNYLFENLGCEEGSLARRNQIRSQYHAIYGERSQSKSFGIGEDNIGNTDFRGRDDKRSSLLSRQIFPLDDSDNETEWMLDHHLFLSSVDADSDKTLSAILPAHTERLLDYCLPSRLLRDRVLPLCALNANASYNFRALMMPQENYFSFRREGQLICRICDRDVSLLDSSEDIHWTLAFTNSLFGGEFNESLVQALYLCPAIRGLSFVRNSHWTNVRTGDEEESSNGHDREWRERDSSMLLANLAGSLPPWITDLAFVGLMDDVSLKLLVKVLETLESLSPGNNLRFMRQDQELTSRAQGKFHSLAVSNSPKLSPSTWEAFFQLLGKRGLSTKLQRTPLDTLRTLDLSGNQLGDELCATVLDIIHDKNSRCRIQELDLSGNRIGAGTSVINVLAQYVDQHDVKGRKAWKSSLQTLRLAANNLQANKAWLKLIALLHNNGLELKVVDLSSNELTLNNSDFESKNVLIRSLTKNTHLSQLNLSNNALSLGAVEEVLQSLVSSRFDSILGFLLIENNSPPLAAHQYDLLRPFSSRSRRNLLQKYIKERESTVDYGLADMSANAVENEWDSETVDDTSIVSEFVSKPSPQGENLITVLFSAPLVYSDGRTLRPFEKLDFDMERELIWQCLKEASRDIELCFDNATTARLLAAMTKRCSCLHYSGHGHQQFLPFEDEKGGPHWFRVEDFKCLIEREGAVPFKFVFVSACHSGLAGETFASAGVKHVVCCQQESELKDTAALAFTRQFYLALAVGTTVKEAFEQGCKAVRTTPNLSNPEGEMKKFLLLPRDGDHDVPIFKARPIAEWPRPFIESGEGKHRRKSKSNVASARFSELSVRNMIQENPSPSPPQYFLGREVDMYHVLKAVLEKRLVSVIGEPGIGRSSLVCSICQYINERASTMLSIRRIYYVRVKQSKKSRFTKLVKSLLKKIDDDDQAVAPDAEIETMLDAICQGLLTEKALVVFDRVELLEDEADEFPPLVSRLCRDTKNVKVLLTNSRQLGIPSLGEHPILLGPLNFANTVRLFTNLCPYLITSSDRKKVVQAIVCIEDEAELLPTDPGLHESTRKIFRTLGDGIPAKIEHAAYHVSKEDLFKMKAGNLRDS